MAPRRNRKPPIMVPPRSSNRNPPIITSSRSNSNSNHSPPMIVSPTDSAASPPPITSNNNPPPPMTFSPPTTEPTPPPYESFAYNQHLSRLEQSAELYLNIAGVAPRSSDGLPRGKPPRRLAQLIANHVEDLCRTMMSTDFDVASRDLVRVTRVAEMLGRWDMDLKSFGRLREFVDNGVKHLSWVYDREALGRFC